MSFDLDTYRRTVTPVEIDDIDFGAFESRPLSESALRALRYMHDVESHTVCYLRDLLLTHAHEDPRITTFLTMWNYEEYWHGVAIGRILEAHGEPSEDERVGPMRARLGFKDKISPWYSAIGSALMGPDFIAMHMTWGAVNEWSTAAGYDRLANRENHPVLTTLLGRIAKQESRHIAFYATEARERLARSRKAQKVTRFALRYGWAPVGSPVMPVAETSFLLDHLLGGAEGRELARRIDRKVAGLPGMAGLSIVEPWLVKHDILTPAGTRATANAASVPPLRSGRTPVLAGAATTAS
ncbi:MAG TPA: ferritin-like domain-containing protein [Frankiaceae bacterium]|nr:ferritin-like domain-containing protein [Frankiaceae bacterium]